MRLRVPGTSRHVELVSCLFCSLRHYLPMDKEEKRREAGWRSRSRLFTQKGACLVGLGHLRRDIFMFSQGGGRWMSSSLLHLPLRSNRFSGFNGFFRHQYPHRYIGSNRKMHSLDGSISHLCLFDEEPLMVCGRIDPRDVSAHTGCCDAGATKRVRPGGVGRLHATSV